MNLLQSAGELSEELFDLPPHLFRCFFGYFCLRRESHLRYYVGLQERSKVKQTVISSMPLLVHTNDDQTMTDLVFENVWVTVFDERQQTLEHSWHFVEVVLNGHGFQH